MRIAPPVALLAVGLLLSGCGTDADSPERGEATGSTTQAVAACSGTSCNGFNPLVSPQSSCFSNTNVPWSVPALNLDNWNPLVTLNGSGNCPGYVYVEARPWKKTINITSWVERLNDSTRYGARTVNSAGYYNTGFSNMWNMYGQTIRGCVSTSTGFSGCTSWVKVTG